MMSIQDAQNFLFNNRNNKSPRFFDTFFNRVEHAHNETLLNVADGECFELENALLDIRNNVE